MLAELLQGPNLVFAGLFVAAFILLAVRSVPLRDWGNVFISIGILGTFWGILIALMAFDTSNIDGSVPKLIDGMRTAFATSVAGMGLALLARVGAVVSAPRAETGEPTAADYHRLLTEQADALKAIQQSLGEGDRSVLGQMDRLRIDVRDFMEKLEKQSTEAIVEALKKVVEDFNTNLTEQFGENFKQLNDAVGRMVTWMDKHQKLVTDSHAQLQLATTALQAAASSHTASAEALERMAASAQTIQAEAKLTLASIGRISPELEKIRTAVEALSGDSTTLGQNVSKLSGNLETLTEANTRLAGALTALQKISESSGSTTASINAMTRAVKDNADAVAEQHQALITTLRKQVEGLSTALQAAQAGLVADLKTALAGEVRSLRVGLESSQKALLRQLNADLKESGRRNKQAVDEQIAALDKALEAELSKAMDVLIGKLGSLSNKFTSDYMPLTQELQRVVQLARTIESERAGRSRG